MDDLEMTEMEEEARFEEGKPADPTKNMSPEDAKKWEEMNDKYDDKFTKGAASEVELREAVIKLAFDKPEYRDHLLPLVVTAADTFKCPNCGTKVLKQTGFCVKCKKKVSPK